MAEPDNEMKKKKSERTYGQTNERTNELFCMFFFQQWKKLLENVILSKSNGLATTTRCLFGISDNKLDVCSCDGATRAMLTTVDSVCVHR